MVDDPGIRNGGCCCGAVRFEISAEPVLVEICHCRTCRRASGAPVMALAGIPVTGFRFVKGEPGRFASSPGVTRSFCALCGTSLTLYSEAFPGEIYVSVCSLDDPEALAPEVHNLDIGPPRLVRDGGRAAALPPLPFGRGVRPPPYDWPPRV
jgi:hypothetical protein